MAEVLRRELARPSWEREVVAIGAATDPYQPAEGRYKLTRACLEVLGDVANPIRIITRGPMIVRDIDVLARAAQRASVAVTFSVPTLDHEIWRRTEPGTAPPHQRLRALKQLVDAGIQGERRHGADPSRPERQARAAWPTSCERRARPARPACGRTFSISSPARRSTSSRALERDWPELVPEYERLYGSRAYLSKESSEPVRAQVRELTRAHGIRDRRRVSLEPPEEPEQLQLAV